MKRIATRLLFVSALTALATPALSTLTIDGYYYDQSAPTVRIENLAASSRAEETVRFLQEQANRASLHG